MKSRRMNCNIQPFVVDEKDNGLRGNRFGPTNKEPVNLDIDISKSCTDKYNNQNTLS